jgi:hypothetical protein
LKRPTPAMTGMGGDTLRPVPYETGAARAALGRRMEVSECKRMKSFWLASVEEYRPVSGRAQAFHGGFSVCVTPVTRRR